MATPLDTLRSLDAGGSDTPLDTLNRLEAAPPTPSLAQKTGEPSFARRAAALTAEVGIPLLAAATEVGLPLTGLAGVAGAALGQKIRGEPLDVGEAVISGAPAAIPAMRGAGVLARAIEGGVIGGGQQVISDIYHGHEPGTAEVLEAIGLGGAVGGTFGFGEKLLTPKVPSRIGDHVEKPPSVEPFEEKMPDSLVPVRRGAEKRAIGGEAALTSKIEPTFIQSKAEPGQRRVFFDSELGRWRDSATNKVTKAPPRSWGRRYYFDEPPLDPEGLAAAKAFDERLKGQRKQWRSSTKGRELDGGDRAIGAGLDPNGTFGGDPFVGPFAREGSKTVGAPAFTQPHNVSTVPAWKSMIANVYKWATDEKIRGQRIGRGVERIFKGLGEDDRSDVMQAFLGLRRTPQGELRQSLEGVPEAVNKKATALRELKDRLHTIMTGIDTRAFSIAQDLGLLTKETTPAEQAGLFRRLRAIQDHAIDINDPNIPHTEIEAANRMYRQRDELGRGSDSMLWFDSSHDTSVPFTEGFAFARDELNWQLKNAQAEYAMFSQQADKQAEAAHVGSVVQDLQRRLDNISPKVPLDPTGQRLPGGNFIPRKAGGRLFINNDPELARMGFDSDPADVFKRYVSVALKKRTMDRIYQEGRNLQQLVKPQYDPLTGRLIGGDPRLSDYLPEYLRTLSGSKGLEGDIRAARHISDSIGKDVKPEDVRHWLTSLGNLNLAKIYFPGLKFSTLHGTQAPRNVLPIASLDPRYKFSNFAKAVAHAMDPKAWKRAAAAGLIEIHEPFLIDLDVQASRARTPAGRNALWMLRLFSRFPKMAYDSGRVIAHETGLIDAARPGFKPHPMVARHIDPSIPMGSIKYRHEYAKALTRQTMFDFSVYGKPTALTQGGWKRPLTAFKAYHLAQAAYLKDLYKSGDKVGLGIAASALWMLGGVPAMVGSGTLYEVVRHGLLKHGIDVLPDPQTGVATLADRIRVAGHSASEFLPDVDISKSVPPFDMFIPPSVTGLPAWVANFAAGPIYGSVYEFASDLSVKGPVAALEQYITGGIPALLEGADEIRTGRVLSKSGKSLVRDVYEGGTQPRAKTAPVVRMVSLSPSARVQKKATLAEVSALMEGGFTKRAADVVRKAREQHGIVITYDELSRMQHGIERRRAAK